jgi:hypothetical protein
MTVAELIDHLQKLPPDAQVDGETITGIVVGRVIEPLPYEGEASATLQLGATTVRLSYTALSLITGWVAVGAHGYGRPDMSDAVIKAFEAITHEAAGASRKVKP